MLYCAKDIQKQYFILWEYNTTETVVNAFDCLTKCQFHPKCNAIEIEVEQSDKLNCTLIEDSLIGTNGRDVENGYSQTDVWMSDEALQRNGTWYFGEKFECRVSFF